MVGALIPKLQAMRNSNLGPYVPPDFSPSWQFEAISNLFYTSLGVMILAAFTALLIKLWVLEFSHGLRAMSIQEQQARTREFCYLGIKRRMLTEMVGILPSLIQVSLILFTIAIAMFLFHISILPFGITTAILSIFYNIYLSV